MNKLNMSIYIKYPDGQVFYTGKIIGKTYYRNLKFNHCVVWYLEELGLNVEILDYLKQNEIKNIVYIDTAKRDHAVRITIKKYDKEKLMREFKFGRQWFVKVGAANPLKKIPYLPYVANKVIIESKDHKIEDLKGGE